MFRVICMYEYIYRANKIYVRMYVEYAPRLKRYYHFKNNINRVVHKVASYDCPERQYRFQIIFAITPSPVKRRISGLVQRIKSKANQQCRAVLSYSTVCIILYLFDASINQQNFKCKPRVCRSEDPSAVLQFELQGSTAA